MNRLSKIAFLTLLIALLLPGKLCCWGFFGHRLINKMAVFSLPPEMIGFYKQHIEYVSKHAVDPDSRKHTDPGEAPRHYIDLEYYLPVTQSSSIDSIPFNWKEAVSYYSEDSLIAWGHLPWAIKRTYYGLVKAFRDGNLERILRLSSDLGHYVADANVPLHTTVNYDGQLTGQKGIHGLWESKVPELESDNYDFLVGKAIYIHDLDNFLRNIISQSHMEKDTVLAAEKKLTERFATDGKYALVEKYKTIKKDYSEEFVFAYANELNGMVERKMRSSILAVSSIWYTAWVNAGQPDWRKLQEHR